MQGRLGILSLAAVVLVAAALAVVESPDPATADNPCGEEVGSGLAPAGSLLLGPDRRLWVPEEREERLAALDPESERVERFALPRGTPPRRLVGGPDGNVWFTASSGSIGSVDPRTRRARLHRLDPGARPLDLVFDREGDGIFFSDEARGLLGHLDLDSGRVTEHAAGLPRGNRIAGLSVDLVGNVWAALPGADRIVRFNVRSERFDRSVRFSRGSRPRSVLFLLRGERVPSLVYATLPGSGKLGEYDTGNGRVSEHETGVPASARGGTPALDQMLVGPDATSLWITTGDARLVRRDLREGENSTVRCGLPPGGRTSALAIGPDQNVWTALGSGGSLVRID